MLGYPGSLLPCLAAGNCFHNYVFCKGININKGERGEGRAVQNLAGITSPVSSQEREGLEEERRGLEAEEGARQEWYSVLGATLPLLTAGNTDVIQGCIPHLQEHPATERGQHHSASIPPQWQRLFFFYCKHRAD